jgi:fatty-acyl-CoA synthase
MTLAIRSEADIRAVEAGGLDAFLPARSPYALLRRAAVQWPEACAIHYVPSGGGPEQRVRFAELFDRVNCAIRLFHRLGAGRGAPVAVIMPHTVNTQVALWAAERAAIACPINPMLQADHIVALLRASGARIAVVLGGNDEVDVWDRVSRAVKAFDSSIVVLDADGDGPSHGSDGCFEALLDAEPAVEFADPDPAATASLYPTGGTTGAPKLTIHTHQNEAFVATAAARMYDLAAGELMLNGFPLFHVAGAFVYGLSCVASGAAQLVPGRLGLRNRPFVATLWEQVESYGINFLGAVPTVLSGLLSQPVGNANIGSLRGALTGGSLLPTDLANAFEAMTHVPVRNIFGMTECSGMLTAEPMRGPRMPGSTGLRLPFTEIRVVRPGTGEPCAAGCSGLVTTRGPHVSPGYLDPALGSETFLAGGWLSTGDLGYQDEAGRVFLTGRAKDVIIRGGHNIDPGWIEYALMKHPAVAIAAAVGLPDRYAGELPAAFVTLHPGTTATETELLAFASQSVPEPAACPKRIWIVDVMPLTAVGKIFKPALRAEAAREAVIVALAPLVSPPTVLTVNADASAVVVTVTNLAPDNVAQLRAALAGMPMEVRFSVA